VSTGRPSRLSNSQRDPIANFVLTQIDEKDGGRLIGEDIQAFIACQFGVDYS